MLGAFFALLVALELLPQRVRNIEMAKVHRRSLHSIKFRPSFQRGAMHGESVYLRRLQESYAMREPDEAPEVSIGIDLGTTNSLVAFVDPETKEPEVVSMADSPTLPSVVAFVPGKDVIVGSDAQKLAAAGAGGKLTRLGGSVFSSVKRIIGRPYEDASLAASNGALRSVMQEELNSSAISGSKLVCPSYNSGFISPEDVSGYVIKELKKRAETALKRNATKAVITVPAWFDTRQRGATEEAAMKAGFEKVRLLREPEAAALAYGIDKEQDQLILVFDLGGGTFDCSILEVGGGAIEVLTTGGDDTLGGDDFDTAIVEWFVEEYREGKGIDLNKVPVAMARLRLIARNARERLSEKEAVRVQVAKIDGENDFECKITRQKFEELIEPLLMRLVKPLRQVALSADVALPGDEGETELFFNDEQLEGVLDEIEPEKKTLDDKERAKRKRVKRKKERTQRERNALRKSVDQTVRNPKTSGKVSKLPTGYKLDQVVLVGGTTRTPCIIRMLSRITGVEPSRTVDPDHAVALGAAVQAAMLDGRLEQLEVYTPWRAALMRALIFDKHKKSLEDGGPGVIPDIYGSPQGSEQTMSSVDVDLSEEDWVDWDTDEDEEEVV